MGLLFFFFLCGDVWWKRWSVLSVWYDGRCCNVPICVCLGMNVGPVSILNSCARLSACVNITQWWRVLPLKLLIAGSQGGLRLLVHFVWSIGSRSVDPGMVLQ